MTQEQDNAQKPAGEVENLSFEGLMTELEGLVEHLETGDQSLEDSLRTFERGMALTDKGTAMLDAAEKKVEILLKGSNGEPQRSPMEDGGPES